MNPQEQIKALAELDGLDPKHINGDWYVHPEIFPAKQLTSYLSSYDAIIPLLRKQPESILQQVADAADVMTTPTELCEALLRATGKWKE